MAAGGAVQALCKEATCPICQDYFRDPGTIAECGHNFCQGCLAQSWGEKEDGLVVSCPQCREATQRRSLIPNRALKSMTEIVKKLSPLVQKRTRDAEGVCEKHQEPLKLFCKDHEAPICLVCDKSKEHENHEVVPQEEAFQEYKDQFCSRLDILRAEKEKIWTYKADTEKQSQDLLNQKEEERQKTKAEFRRIHQFLEEQEKNVLAQIEEVEKEIARRRDEHLDRLCRELSSLENLIQEMEEKCQQPASEFLQDVRKTLQRSQQKEAFENAGTFPLELTCRIRELSDRKPLLEGVMRQFPAFAANVTLDPDTAHSRLVLSEDHKSVRFGNKRQALPNNPERFYRTPCVLGREGFTTGRHFWEVTVESEGTWAVGVARKSVERKGLLDRRLWAVRKFGETYRVLNDPDSCLTFSQEIKRIRVTLKCDEGQVSFSDADTGVHIYTIRGASFCGEILLPFFYVAGNAHLKLSP